MTRCWRGSGFDLTLAFLTWAFLEWPSTPNTHSETLGNVTRSKHGGTLPTVTLHRLNPDRCTQGVDSKTLRCGVFDVHRQVAGISAYLYTQVNTLLPYRLRRAIIRWVILKTHASKAPVPPLKLPPSFVPPTPFKHRYLYYHLPGLNHHLNAHTYQVNDENGHLGICVDFSRSVSARGGVKWCSGSSFRPCAIKPSNFPHDLIK